MNNPETDLSVLPSDQVEEALRTMSDDPGALSRLALASILFSHGEGVWVFEIAYQVTRMGGVARPQQLAGGIGRVDLVVGGEAFEIKSTMSTYAVINPMHKTEDWFLPDVRKLRGSSVRGHQLITMATMLTARNVRDLRVNRKTTDPAEWVTERDQALAIYRQYAENENVAGVGSVRHINLGRGEVPGGQGGVQLDALLFCVHQA